MLATVNETRTDLDQLARQYGPELVRYAHERTGSLDDAADIVQAAFLKAWTSFRQGTRPEHPRAWLYRIVHNEASNYRRGSGRQKRAALPPGASPDGLLTSEARETVDAVRALPPPFGDAIILHYLQGLSISETADVLGVPEGTAKSQIARGLELLRERIGGR
jgi:RNA polymerase sigma-70 factor (ECF subfamily)